MEKLISPADKFTAAKKRSDHPITQKFVESFDFAFDDFQVAVWKMAMVFLWQRLQGQEKLL